MPEKISQVISRTRNTSIPGQSVKKPEVSDCIPDCPICRGIGWIRVDVPIENPNFGKLQMCPNMDIYKVYGRLLGLTEQEALLSWEDLILVDNDARSAHLAITNTLNRGYGWVYLWGSYGRAKTIILKIAVAEALRKQKAGVYIRMAEFVDNLRLAFDDNNPNTSLVSRLDWWSKLPILAIDEVDKINLTGFAREKMFLLFDRRYEDATLNKTGVTLLSSNLPPMALDPYLTDRIRDGRFAVIEMAGSSVRPALFYPNGV